MSSQSLTTTNIPSNSEDGNRITPAARTPTPSSGSLMQSSINSIGGPVIGGLSAVQLTGKQIKSVLKTTRNARILFVISYIVIV